MKFVKTEDLRTGMRLAKPIYNKKGVLLYERDSLLTIQGIESVKNFGLIGIYILEPAEPLPPMSEEDIEFERFQSIAVFTINDELTNIVKNGKVLKVYNFAQTIAREYGNLDHKINFVQSLRSSTDFVFKHSLNVAILCALMSHKLMLRPQEREELIVAAIVHGVGLVRLDQRGEHIAFPEDSFEEEILESGGFKKLESVFLATPAIKRIAFQAFNEIKNYNEGRETGKGKIVNNAKILMVANEYDKMTAINSQGETPYTEIAALKILLETPEVFDPKAVQALIDSINFLNEGSCVELSNGEKALVVSANSKNVLRPTVLCFSNNRIIDLNQTALYGDIEVADIMKTLDNRHVMDETMLAAFKI